MLRAAKHLYFLKNKKLQILRFAQDDSNLLSLLWVGRRPMTTQDDIN